MNVRYIVNLAPEERSRLEELVSGGSKRVRVVKRAQILLAADQRVADNVISETIRAGTSTVYRTKQRFVEESLDAALHERPRPGRSRLLSAKEEALLVATACTDPPEGRARWTIELLAGEMVRLTDHDSISEETIRRRLHEKELKPWQYKMWCIPKVNADFVAHMEDVLDVYSESPKADEPVVCFDETPRQLIGETRIPIPPKPGQPARIDYEYQRNGTVNLFMMVDAHKGWREVKVTDHRTNVDFAECMRDLVDEHYPTASRIRVVLDNLSTHSQAAVYETFPPDQARRILRRLEFHYTPKHGSWLNMAEIEISVLAGQCLDRRIPDKATMTAEVAAWVRQRNAAGARINWLFDVHKARTKMDRAYPTPKAAPAPMAKGALAA